VTPSTYLFLFPTDYAADLRRRLREYQITPAELAEETGIDRTQFSRWFHSDLQPNQRSIVRIEKGIAAILARRGRGKMLRGKKT